VGSARRAPASRSGAFEQHYVDGTRDSPIAFYCLCYVPGPMFPPVLSLQGWSSVSNTISTKDLRGLMLEAISNLLRRT
ncbi:MAG TPA: hypothetical protein VLL28_16965, partial [Hyphomicrobiaceae bacterium]|nr:hypothetical protein [Hyphomicrobiaceae bacterium]